MTVTLIGDCHAAADDLRVLLQAPALQTGRLVFLGDYIDGVATRAGTLQPAPLDPLGVLDIVMAQVADHGDVALLGNHDDFWVQTAAGDDLSYQTWRLNGGAKTWRQLGIHSSNLAAVKAALTHDPLRRYTAFLQQLPLFWATPELLAIHAGLDWDRPLSAQARDDLLWIRDDYYFDRPGHWHRNLTNQVIITGHTPVQTLRDDGYGMITMQADAHDTPRYLIDAGSRSGAANGGIFALTLAADGTVLAKTWVINGRVVDGNLPHFK
ncbi:metallophosphoesterase [Levilactobacillus suantsaiihabitans]|uniref:Serine/threonine protein phosphatase n=1 Tax=Levilactobacillus suantsaiihabitans TaxID=2487722 RepID=A0A4Z0J8I3_9LACO|nr:metallophosphoesterase [Levilactobacillus suantsaiihabitans]TGD18994.1 serine/threonine protein phosphatase [Levilactobacillus suantsaiihabitans]